MAAPRSFGGMNRGYSGAGVSGLRWAYRAPSMGMSRSFAGSAAGRGFGGNPGIRGGMGLGGRAPVNMGGRSFAGSGLARSGFNGGGFAGSRSAFGLGTRTPINGRWYRQ